METHLSNIKNTEFWELMNKNDADKLISYTMTRGFLETDETVFNNMLEYLSSNYNIPSEYHIPDNRCFSVSHQFHGIPFNIIRPPFRIFLPSFRKRH